MAESIKTRHFRCQKQKRISDAFIREQYEPCPVFPAKARPHFTETGAIKV